MSKYYTPKLEEFRIGFEYEWKNPNEVNWKKESSPTKITQHDYENQIPGLRVKYLDSEDIVSLEFKQDGKIYKDKWGNSIELTGYPNYDCKIILAYSSRKFEGKIKNKSEFKKILKQVGL
jgi:hypothetical protein